MLNAFQVLDQHPAEVEIADSGITPTATSATVRMGPFLDDGIPHTLDDNERGRKDTVRVNPNEVVDIIVRFEVFSGRYMYHCHILDGMPSLTHDQVMTTTALDATQVIPRVRELLDRERLPGPEDVAEPTKATG